MKVIKILHIVETPRFSGAEILVKDLSLSHVERCSVAIGSFNPTEDNFVDTMQELKNKGIKQFIPQKRLKKFERIWYLFKTFREFQPDIVLGHSSVVSVYMRIAGIFFPRIKKIVVLHAVNDYGKGSIWSFLEKILQHYTDQVIAVSERSAYFYQFNFKVKCRVIHNGVHIDKIVKELPNRDANRAEVFNVDQNIHVILQVGRISRVKNQHITLQALSNIDQVTLKNIKLFFAGIIEDINYFNEMQEYIKEQGLKEKVMFLGGRTDIPKLLVASDLFVMPSSRESFGMALIEALAANVKVICSDIPDFNFIKNQEQFEKISLDNVEEFAQQIETCLLLERPILTRDMKEYSFDKCADAYMSLFKELI